VYFSPGSIPSIFTSEYLSNETSQYAVTNSSVTSAIYAHHTARILTSLRKFVASSCLGQSVSDVGRQNSAIVYRTAILPDVCLLIALFRHFHHQAPSSEMLCARKRQIVTARFCMLKNPILFSVSILVLKSSPHILIYNVYDRWKQGCLFLTVYLRQVSTHKILLDYYWL
jgi:hypothetical protein